MAIVNKPSDHFNTVLYTGTGSSGNAITGVGFQPDFFWVKNRTSISGHVLMDIIRGISSGLNTAGSNAEVIGAYLNSFDTDGFNIAATGVAMNSSGDNFASWNWKAGGTAVSNTDGSITSSVSANTIAGFSIVNFQGNGTTGTVGHGLGVAPSMIILKDRDFDRSWAVYHSAISPAQYLYLDQGASATSSGAINCWGNNTTTVATTDSVFTVGSATAWNGRSGDDYIAYCFAEKKGFSKFGSYTGNGSTNGTFVHLPFKPAFVIVKCTSNAGTNWRLHDNKRQPANGTAFTGLLIPNATSAEYTGATEYDMDFLSNGFKLRVGDIYQNGSGASYIYMAFAEQPFVTSTDNGSIPATAR